MLMSLENKKIMADNIKRLMKNKGVNASIVCSDLNISRKDVYRDISELSADALEFLKSIAPAEIKLIKNYRAASEKEKRIVDDLLDIGERKLDEI